jgi:hypothetical protein
MGKNDFEKNIWLNIRQWTLRIKINSELESKYKSQDVSVIKFRRLEWLGHVIRMNETMIIKNIFEKLGGRRGRGRSKTQVD